MTTNAKRTTRPLFVDLDGTLVRTDLLHEGLVSLLKRRPHYVLFCLAWLLRGKAYFKRKVAKAAPLSIDVLPLNPQLVEFLKEQHQSGRALYLLTAADQLYAEQVASRLKIFTQVFASDGTKNLSGANKRRFILEHFAGQEFDYAGNSSSDLTVWQEAREAIVVNASRGLEARAGRVSHVSHVFDPPRSKLKAFLTAMRYRQWIKNLLIFVPLVASHRILNEAELTSALLAFACFCLCASAVYLINDLVDLDHDRLHPRKKSRPLAAGAVSVWEAVLGAVVFLAADLWLVQYLPRSFALCLGFYFVLTCLYSFALKRVAILDVIVLAGLYTVRLVAGHLASDIVFSMWLLAFSMFIFVSLALTKRVAEIKILLDRSQGQLSGRGYHAEDLGVLTSLGTTSGYLSILVFALYIHSAEVTILYKQPVLLWFACPCLLYWVGRIWLLARRGELVDDPVIFASTDLVSYACAGFIGLAMILAGTGI